MTPATRKVMAANKGKETKPELKARRLLHAAGYRYVLHDRMLPGKPDVSFPTRKAVVEVRGCFWHGHGCGSAGVPKTRESYWAAKITANQERDARNAATLGEAGWATHVIWECEQRRHPEATVKAATEFLDARPRSPNARRRKVKPRAVTGIRRTGRDTSR